MKAHGAPYRPGSIRRDVIAGLLGLLALMVLFAAAGAAETWTPS